MAEFKFEYDAMDPNASGGLVKDSKTYRPVGGTRALDNFNQSSDWSGKLGVNSSQDKFLSFGLGAGVFPITGFDKIGGIKFAAGLFGANKDKWYRDYRKWADYWRTGMSNALGYGAGGEDAATDPLSRLQFALSKQVDIDKLNNTFDQNYDATGLINSRNQGLAAILRQQAAGMGIRDAYEPVISNTTNARQTLIDKSLAAYRPEAYQNQQKLSANADQLLQSIQLANTEAQQSLGAAGRTV